MLPAVARLAEIPGVSHDLDRAIIAETGLDMARFPTQGNTWLRSTLGQAANGAARTQTFLGERYHRIARPRGKTKAQVAVARSILVIISLGPAADPATRYTELGHGYYQARTEKDKKIKKHIRQVEALLGHHHHQGQVTLYGP